MVDETSNVGLLILPGSNCLVECHGRVIALLTLLLPMLLCCCYDLHPKITNHQVPIMLKSLLCSLRDVSDSDLMALGECPYDQVGLRVWMFLY